MPSKVLLTLGMLFGSIAGYTKTPAQYAISGTVVDHRMQTPLPSVLVSITAVSNGEFQEGTVSVMTDAGGHFGFRGLAKGKYSLFAQRRGERQQGFQGHGGYSTAIATGPGLDSEHVVFQLEGESRMVGTVVDGDGDPVAQARVSLLMKRIIDGRSKIETRGQNQTNSSGAFHFGHLEPGTYYLAVVGRPWYADHGPAGGETEAPAMLDQAFPITYSGNTTDPEAAQPIVLTEGNVDRSEIVMHAVPALRLSSAEPMPATEGENDHQQPAPPPVRWNAVAIGPGGVDIDVQPEGNEVVEQNGTTRVRQMVGLAPGRYRIVRQSFSERALPSSSEQVVTLTESAPFPAMPADSINLRGRLVLNGMSKHPNLQVQIAGAAVRESAAVQADGSFMFQRNFVAGPYTISLDGEPNIVVQSIRVGKRSIAGSTLTLPVDVSESGEVVVTAGTASRSTLNGLAVQDGKPVPAAMILLLPEGMAEGAVIGRDQSDSDGTFSITNVLPGRYTLVAICDNGRAQAADLEYRDARVMQPYLARGQAVVIPLQGSGPVSVEAVPLQIGK